MEVHKHPHHVTNKKKWPEYVLEFLMLFLAVFLGFLAENVREQSADRHREKEYMQSMIEDLAQDTLEINRISFQNITATKNIDSLLELLQLPLSNNIGNRKKLYDVATAAYGAEAVVFSQRTLSQLKNAGGLRLVRKKEVADLISVYDSKIQYLLLVTKSLDETTTAVNTVGNEIFDLNYFRQHHDSDWVMMSYDPKTLKKFSNFVLVVRHIFDYYEDHLQEEKKVAIRLAALIRKHYQLQ